MTTLDDIREYSPFYLASPADCASPDAHDSPGALMLCSVRDAVVEAIESGSITLQDFDDSGQLHQIADDAPSIYTHERWRQFADLAAWQEEPETGEWPDDLTKTAGVALYQIAYRLAYMLAMEWRDGWECPTCGDTGEPFLCAPGECSDAEAVEEARKRDALAAMVAERAEAARVQAEADAARVEAETDSDMRRMDAIRSWHEAEVRSDRFLTWSAAAVLAIASVITVLAVML